LSSIKSITEKMGCDGGTKVDRRDIIVKVKKTKKSIDKDLRSHLAWTTCALSKEPLAEPIVCCALGRLYNKEALVEALIRRKSTKKPDPSIEHILSLKDIFTVRFTHNSEKTKDDSKSLFVCPITQQEIRGQYKFYLMQKCGHVVSEKALQMTDATSAKSCLVCNEPSEAELIMLNPPEDQEKDLREKLMFHIANKKGKKRSRKGEGKKEEDEEMRKKKKVKTMPKESQPEGPTTSSVYKSLFVDKTKLEKDDGSNFLCRGGMRGPARVQ
jgi:hypothetical protein